MTGVTQKRLIFVICRFDDGHFESCQIILSWVEVGGSMSLLGEAGLVGLMFSNSLVLAISLFDVPRTLIPCSK